MKFLLDEDSLSDCSNRWNNLGPHIDVPYIPNRIFNNTDSEIEEEEQQQHDDNSSFDTTSPTSTITQRNDFTTLDSDSPKLSQISDFQDADKWLSSEKLPRNKTIIISNPPRTNDDDENMSHIQQVSQVKSRSYSNLQFQNPLAELTAGEEDIANEQVQLNHDNQSFLGGYDSSSDISALTNNDMIENTIIIPTNEDVKCGRGGHINTHPGNQELRTAAISLKPYYLSASNRPGEKRIFCKQLVAIIHNRGGRFLKKKKDGGGIGDWYVISNKDAEDKCSQLFREGSEAEKQALRQQGIQLRRKEGAK